MPQSLTAADLKVPMVGEALYDSPQQSEAGSLTTRIRVVPPGSRVLLDPTLREYGSDLGLELAGPAKRLAFDPAACTAAVVTCGGLCPGLNDVIRAIVMSCHWHYGVKRVLGIPYGYNGFASPYRDKIRPLDPEAVSEIHRLGGTILGSSRGTPPVSQIVDVLQELGVNLLFTLGGDGTQRGSLEIYQEATRRGLRLAVVGVPKTIDNDIVWVERTFGFDTAVERAAEVVDCAHVEAKAAPAGLGLVKVMGRDSGFVAAGAALASGDANLVLIPEVRFSFDKLCQWLSGRLEKRGHAVIVVAEGAGQDVMAADAATDASGNTLHGDIGVWLRDRIKTWFAERKQTLNIKYIDPSYTIRSSVANASDAILCMRLGYNAVHAAMAGKTGCMVGLWNSHFTLVPIALTHGQRKKVDPGGAMWQTVLETTGQASLREAPELV